MQWCLYTKIIMRIKNKYISGCRDGSVNKNIDLFSRGPLFNSRSHMAAHMQLLGISVLLASVGTRQCIWHMDIHADKTLVDIKKVSI